MRRIMKHCIVVSSLIMIFGISGCGTVYNYHTQELEPKEALHEGMPQLIVVSGSNYEMGYQYAQQVAPLIYNNHVLSRGALVSRYGEEVAAKDLQVWTYYWFKYDPGLKDWLEGMSVGCNEMGYEISPLDIAAISLYPVELWGRPDTPYPEEAGVQSAAKVSVDPADPAEYHSCTSLSATGSATRDGKPVVAVTKMVPIETMQCSILIAFPDEGHSFVGFPRAGQVAAGAGMNSAGFAATETAIFGPKVWGYDINGYFHYLPQYCESTAEAREYLESTPRAGVMGTVNMADAAGDIFVFEGNALDLAIREPGEAGETAPFLVETNHLVHADMQSYNIPWEKWAWNLGSKYRYATAFEYVKAAAEKSEIDFEFIKAMYSSDDWYDPDAKTWHYNEPGSRNLNNNFPSSVAQAVLFPADLIAYFQIGTPSGIGVPVGATGEYVKLKLADGPATVTENAKKTAFGYYREARNFFEKKLNNNAPYLTYSITQSLGAMLDKAMLEYQRGMDKNALAIMAKVEGTPVNEEVALWSEALTHYAKTQLYAQMVTTQLEKLAAP